ncbi:MAG: DUF3794 domain-containing protein [Oscillospiraceae bacterium]|jgi:hypothetical protein|nr:DUF3794 domain-containing protein [Oscillospiraceae bacterium]
MELKMRTIHFFEPILESDALREESAEIIVPDMFPDISRVLDTSGLAVVKEKSLREEQAEIFGVVKASVLYVPEGEQGLKKVDVTLPFSHLFEGRGIGPGDRAVARAAVLSAETYPVNPRKVQVRVSVRLDITVYHAAYWEICQDVEEAARYGIHTRREIGSAYLPVVVSDKIFTVTDEWEAPGSRPPIFEILRTDIRLHTQEAKPVGNKLVFKGAAFLRILYAGPPVGADPADDIVLLEQEVPFSQIIEWGAGEEACDCVVDLQLAGLELDLRDSLSGESRLLGVTLQVDAQAVGMSPCDIETVTDLYSTDYGLLPEFRTYRVGRLLDRSVRRQAVRESGETGRPVSAVAAAQVALGPVGQQRAENQLTLTAQATVNVVYVADDRRFYELSWQIPVSHTLEAPADALCSAAAYVCGDVLATGTHDGVEVRFPVDFAVTLSATQPLTALAAVEIDREAVRDHSGQPSVVLRRARKGETLWQLAKAHGTTTGDIAQANRLEEEAPLAAGQMLLVPRHR